MRLLLFCSLLLIGACSSTPEIAGLDSKAWKSDIGGCEGIRASQLESIDLEESIIGVTESDIVRLMGKPDQNELYKRNQKFYVYELGPCGETAAPYLQIRFSATNIAREAMVYEP